MVNVVSLKCPDCQANIEIQEGKKKCFCSYCGRQLLLDDGSVTITHRTIDHTRIREVELEQQLKLKQMEIDAIEKKERSRKQSILLGIWLLSVVVLLLLSIFTADEANFSPFQLVLIADIVLGIKLLLNSKKAK